MVNQIFAYLFFLFLIMPVFSNENSDFKNAVRESVNRQMNKYPKSTLRDIYKSFFQDKYGPGHIINDTTAANRYLFNELNSYSEIKGEIAEPTGWQHNFYRVNLSVIKDKLIPHEIFLDAFIRSVNEIEPIPIEDWKKEWYQIEKIIKSMGLSIPDYDKDYAEIEERLKEGNYIGHHSDAYNDAYAPHYRIISKKIFEEEIFPLLEKFEHKSGETRYILNVMNKEFKKITGTIYSEQRSKNSLQLISSSEKGDIETVKSLLKKDVYIHAQDKEGRCALVVAAYNNHLEIVDLLINDGADVNMKDNTLQSAYLISTSEGYTELLRKTLKAGADVYSTDSYNGTGLIRAADRGHVEIIRELLKTDIRVNHINRLGWTALLEAIILGDGGKRHTEVVRLLVDAGADVNLPDKDGVTPLAHAKKRKFFDIIKILENLGAE